MATNALTIETPNIAKVFGDSVTLIRSEMIKNQHKDAVDVEINFQNVTLSKKGFLVFSKKTESTMTIKMATRILPQV